MKALFLLCVSLVAEVEWTLTIYYDSECINDFYVESEIYDGSCDGFLSWQRSRCENYMGESGEDTICAGMVLHTCFTNDWIENALAGGAEMYMYYECGEVVTCDDGKQNGDETGVDCGGTECEECPPTCDDGIQNGDETGVDCGGSDCEICPASCSTMDCESYGEQYVMDDGGDYTCAGNPCSATDITTCCIARASCSSLSCPPYYVLVSDASSTFCANSECDASDEDVCCALRQNCTGYDLCDEDTQYLRDDAENGLCDTEVCGIADQGTCCENRVACREFRNCDADMNLTLIDNKYYTLCELNVCTDEDSDVCCTEMASCWSFRCDRIGDRFLNKSNKASLLCQGETCWHYIDAWTCCDEKQSCEDWSAKYTCPSGMYLPDDPSWTWCADLNCTAEDVERCCDTLAPTKAPTVQSSGGGIACFSLDGVVETISRGVISLGDLQIGDLIRDSLNGHTKVVGFLHHDKLLELNFLELTTDTSTIVVTKDHLLRTDRGFIQAKDMKPGMNLKTVNNFYQKVVRAESVVKTGVIAPLTESGVLSVNGFQVSCYAHVPGQLHWLVDLLMWPRKQFVWSQDGIDAYAVAVSVILYLPWKLALLL